TLKMPAFEWVHVQLHQQKGMISLSPPTICNSANRTLQNGWFEGFIISKSGHKYVFVSALTGNLGSNLTSSIKAKKNAITILNTLNL
ncbi:hypothetical protein, partial [Escherichia coli]|uniref:hypothetical protein n=1 Tax=Escherichia coli TaxID=562 RepID=UPI003D9A45EE